MRRRVWLSLLIVILATAIAAGSAGAGSPPNRLDDNRGRSNVVGLADDACNAILGPFQVLSWFDLDVCPDMSGRVLADGYAYHRTLVTKLGGTVLPPC